MIVAPVTQEIVWSVGVQLVVASLLWLFFPKDAKECIPPTDISLNRLPNQALHLSCFIGKYVMCPKFLPEYEYPSGGEDIEIRFCLHYDIVQWKYKYLKE